MFRRGFSLVEALLAVAIFAVILVFLVVAYINARESTFLSGQRVRATVLAKEGVSAVRNLRDEDFA
ncbi:MAG: prepilin-type N-terminal cleavage/methylation domain-containing protein, partial [Candidatus Moranbacteria bacterium]|nr:prepilin-type N-terminal cleavage/methylation domain-containing protein [Candidatus Moranbacteria bacterium]